MRDVLNPTSTKNTVGMLRTHDKKSILILEGESDSRALAQFVNRSTCRPLVATNKTEAIETVEWADIQGLSGVLAIVDKDFVDIIETRSNSSNVFYTDYYDLDVHLFFSKGTIERCIEHLCNYDKYSEADEGASTFRDIMEKSTSMARLVGCLRLYSRSDGCDIPLDKFPFGEVYRGQALALDVDRLTAVTVGRFKGSPCSDPENVVKDWLRRATAEKLPSEQLAQGHDLFSCLGIVVGKSLGSSHRGELWERFARSHLKKRHIQTSHFYQAVLDWCNASGHTVWAM